MSLEKDWRQRTELVLGEENLFRLQKSHVLIVGIGGVGGYVAEFLARSGVGEITIVDADNVELTNLNRQIVALHSTLGKEKVSALSSRMKDINPEIVLHIFPLFLTEGNLDTFIDQLGRVDFVVDAIDTLPSKIALIMKVQERGIPIISSMGAGGRIDPSRISVADLNQTHHCPLSKVLRKGLREKGFYGKLPVVFSTEELVHKTSPIGSMAHCVATFGAYLSAYVIDKLISSPQKQ
ncbi:MAG TPA: tRNA threonylcarbamoyladenosine dehydratase [Porphyromonadaceae bacterium]|nr:tRNA threonylcarbamoyladenosine dehydratase [Porphyromonadaceae bacterium]